MDIFQAKIGDKVGFVDGPGVFPQNNVGIIIKKIETKWGKELVVKMKDNIEKHINSFTTIGAGAYYLS